MTVHLTLDLAKQLVERAIAEKGEDYVYLPPGGRVGEPCLNWHLQPDGQMVPGCIVGHVWHYLGFTNEDTGQGDAKHVLGYLEGYDHLTYTEDAADFLYAVQDQQDRGVPWGEAYKEALEFMDAKSQGS
jgi:hypothetical protein